MKVFVTGVAGQLGHDIMNDLAARGYEGIGTDIASEYNGISDGTAVTRMPYVSLDITDRTAVEQVIGALKPDVVIHCAAWTAVDLAEDDDKKAKVHAINADGTQNIADACKKIDAKMVYISTDYVFDGQGTTPWQPDCKDYAPLNVYGQTKLDGELAVANTLEKYFIVRIAWVFGVNGKNFIKTMLNAGKTHDKLTVVSDQRKDIEIMGQIKVQKNVGGIEGLCIIEPTVHGDNRGYFMETYNSKDMQEAGIDRVFVQDNQSCSTKGVLRGLHFQKEYPQAKLVRAVKGSVFDVAVDLRSDSKTYGKWFGVELTEENKKQFLIPEGFAHGFLVLSDVAEFCYKVTDFWHLGDESGLAWNDPAIGIEWPQLVGEYPGSADGSGYTLEDGTPINLSDKDQKWETLKNTFKF